MTDRLDSFLTDAVTAARTRASAGVDDGASTRLRLRESFAAGGSGIARRKRRFTIIAAVIASLFGSAAFAAYVGGWRPLSSEPPPSTPEVAVVAPSTNRTGASRGSKVEAPAVIEPAPAVVEPAVVEPAKPVVEPAVVEPAKPVVEPAVIEPAKPAVVPSNSKPAVVPSNPKPAMKQKPRVAEPPPSTSSPSTSSPSTSPPSTSSRSTSPPSTSPPSTSSRSTSSPSTSSRSTSSPSTSPSSTSPRSTSSPSTSSPSTSSPSTSPSSTSPPSTSSRSTSSPSTSPPSTPSTTTGPRVDAPLPTPPSNVGDLAAYRVAHEAHFRGTDPAAALAAWDAYLARFPNGQLAPEARYDRALVLIKLKRYAEAKQALAPFANAAAGSYRQREAAKLLAALPK